MFGMKVTQLNSTISRKICKPLNKTFFIYQVTEEYSYLKLDAAQNYYNVQYEDDGRVRYLNNYLLFLIRIFRNDFRN